MFTRELHRSVAIALVVGSLACVAEAQTVYWTVHGVGVVQRARVDSAPETLISGLTRPTAIALDLSAEKIYFAGGDGIERSDLDGSNREFLLVTNADALALDIDGGKMYWPAFTSIQRANLDGSDPEVIISGLIVSRGLALDPVGGKFYFTDEGSGTIFRANLDGSDMTELLTGLGTTRDLALDLTAGKIYWADFGNLIIQRANLDGSAIEDLVTQSDDQTITLDTNGGKMYLAGTSIRRADLDGTNLEVIQAGVPASALAVDAGNPAIPAVSQWGLSVMVLLVLTAGTLLMQRQTGPPANLDRIGPEPRT